MNGHSAKREDNRNSWVVMYFNLHVPIVFSSETKVAKSKNVNKKSLYIGNEKEKKIEGLEKIKKAYENTG